MPQPDVSTLLAEGYAPENIWISQTTAARLMGISLKCLLRYRSQGDVPHPRAFGTRGLLARGSTENGQTRRSQVLRYNLEEFTEWLKNEPTAGEVGEDDE